jgi:hypothetical protein
VPEDQSATATAVGPVSALDALLSDERLQPAARGVLLLRVCLIAQALRPDIVDRYWEELKALSGHLPAASREAFEGLEGTLEPPAPTSRGGFAGEIADAVATAEEAESREEKLAALRECEQRIKSKRWPFGKGPAWDALVHAWIEVDRTEGLMRVEHLPRAVQTNLLIRENDRSPLAADEWQAVHQRVPKAARAAVEELLERDDLRLDLPAEVAADVGRELVKAMFQGAADDREAETQRDRAWERHAKLVKALAERSPEVAVQLLERWFQATADTPFYGERWPSRFFALFRIVAQWCSYPALELRLADFVTSSAPAYLRDAVLAHGAALKPESAEEADAAWATLEPQLASKEPAEHWFLLTLLRGGLPEYALEMGRRSPQADEILPCLRRAWLYEHPESARTAIRPEEVAEDEIADFLLRDSGGRVELLRDRTRSGDAVLPEAMWKAPSALDILDMLERRESGPRRDGPAVGSWFDKTVPKERQFAVFVQIHGYARHLYEHFDPILLETMVAWDEAHHDEAVRVANRMWEVMRDQIKPNIRLDLVRSDILDRCEAVLGASPATADRFVRWLYDELVKQPLRQQEGDTIYTFQLNEQAPFLYALLTAQKVARASARRCDEILEKAISAYPASDELLTAAAQLYAADKGLAGLEPPAALKEPGQLTAWQLGVVNTSLQDLLAALVVDTEPETASAVAGPALGLQEIGILFDIDELGGGFYGLAAYRIFFRNLDPERLAACALYEGDTTETLSGRAREFCIAVQALDPAQIEYVRDTMRLCDEKGLLHGEGRFLLGEVTIRHPLVLAGHVDAVGRLVVGPNQTIGDAWVEGTAWKIAEQ